MYPITVYERNGRIILDQSEGKYRNDIVFVDYDDLPDLINQLSAYLDKGEAA